MPVQCGHVYVKYWAVANKEKLLVPAHALADGRIRFFIINSEVAPFLLDKAELAKHVFALKQASNASFLNHDSWLCCNELLGGFQVSDLEAPECYRGPIDASTTAKVRAAIQQSKLYSAKEKAEILHGWP